MSRAREKFGLASRIHNEVCNVAYIAISADGTKEEDDCDSEAGSRRSLEV